jgi:hypothetical protein
MHTPTLFFVLLVSTVLVSSPAMGQSNYAVLGGTVIDPQQRAIPGADVRLTSTSTQAERHATTNDQGIFQITGLLPGEYKVAIQTPGFAPFSRTLRLEVGQQALLDVNLNLAAVIGTVDVSGLGEILNTADASAGEVIEPTAIRNLPLNGRMLIDLVLTVPGAHASHGAQTGNMNPLYWRPGQRSAVSVGGNRPNANYFLLDGTTNTDPTFNTLNLSPSPDAVQEFKVLTGSYSAEMGGAGGGQVNIVTRSGSNTLHGTVYEFLRNDALDARTFNEMSSNHLVRNNFGGSLGGPIARNKAFFFANYEGLRHTKSNTMIATVPTESETLGDFSASGTTIYNPFSAQPNPAFDPTRPISPTNPQILRDPFPGNVIPDNLLDPAAASFLRKYAPRPNMEEGMMGCGMTMMGAPTVIGAGVDCNNYLDVRNERHVTDQATFRVDYIFSQSDNLSVRYSFSGENGFMPQNLPGFGAFHDNFSQHGNIAWNRVISPRAMNMASIAVSRLSMHRSSENSESNDIVSELGIQGVGFGGKGAYGAPWFNVQGYSGMGDSFAATPMHAWDTVIEGRDELSLQLGRHSLKLGGSARYYIWPMWGFFQNRGYYQFTNGFTTRTATADGTGSALASFLLGLPAVKQRQAGIPQMQLRQWYADAFIQDGFQLTRNTTVQVGLRYEYMSPLKDIRYANTNLTFKDGVPSVFVGGQNGYPEGLIYAKKLNFAPRLGLSHHIPSHGIVIHGAYGIFFTPVDMNTWCNQRHNVPYVFPETQQSDNFVPAAGIVASHFNFGTPVLGQTVVSFAAIDPEAPSQYIQQWSFSAEKSLDSSTTIEAGYLGSHGVHLQRSHLNWRLSAVYQAQSGYPFTVSVFGDTANAGTLLGENPIRANTTGEPVFGEGTRTADRWFNPAAFAAPPAFAFGNAGRNSIYGPGMQTLDVGLQRDFILSEKVTFQFRGEFFNALNHTNLGIPNRFVNTPQFGTITEAATPGREIQLGARLSF